MNKNWNFTDKKDALTHSLLVWDWLSLHPLLKEGTTAKRKAFYALRLKYTTNYCALCAYVRSAIPMTYCTLGDCLLDWDVKKKCSHPCEQKTSPYKKWREAETVETRVKWATTIRDMILNLLNKLYPED